MDAQNAAEPQVTKKLGIFPQDKLINPDRLNDELKAVLGDKLLSIETGQMRNKAVLDDKGEPVIENGVPVTTQEGPSIYVVVSDAATADDLAAVEQLLKEHDPDKLSAKQQREKDAVDSYARLSTVDFAAMRKLVGEAKADAIIDVLEDWQRLMVAARG